MNTFEIHRKEWTDAQKTRIMALLVRLTGGQSLADLRHNSFSPIAIEAAEILSDLRKKTTGESDVQADPVEWLKKQLSGVVREELRLAAGKESAAIFFPAIVTAASHEELKLRALAKAQDCFGSGYSFKLLPGYRISENNRDSVTGIYFNGGKYSTVMTVEVSAITEEGGGDDAVHENTPGEGPG